MTQIIINLPLNIPAPKFSLFQKVRFIPKNSRYTCNQVGTVVGLDYITFRFALKEDLNMGWQYSVDWVYDASETEAIDQTDARETFAEDLLESVGV